MPYKSREMIVTFQLDTRPTVEEVSNCLGEIWQMSQAFESLVDVLSLMFDRDCESEDDDSDEADFVRFIHPEVGAPGSIVISSVAFADPAEIHKTQQFIEQQLAEYQRALTLPNSLVFEID